MKQNILPFPSDVFKRCITPHRWHGILVGYVTAPFYFIFGIGQDTGVMINSVIFFIVLILSVYGIGTTVWNQKAGVLSAFIVSMYPQIFNHLRIYMLDLPLTAMVCLSIFLLLKTNYFSRKLYSFLFGFSVALGLLIKFNFIIFIIGPFVIILLKILTSQRFTKKAMEIILYNIVVSVGIIFIIMFPFLQFKKVNILGRIYDSSWFNPLYTITQDSLGSFLFYRISSAGKLILLSIFEMYNTIMSLFFLVIFIFCLIYYLKTRVHYKLIFLLWIFLPLIIMSPFFHLSPPFYSFDRCSFARYLMPLLPPIALISGITIARIKYPNVRKIIIGLIVFWGCIQYCAISYNLSFVPEKIALYLPDHLFDINNYFPQITFFSRDIPLWYRNDKDQFSYPVQTKLPIDEIVKQILNELNGGETQAKVTFTDNIPDIYEPIEYLSYTHKYPFRIFINSLSEESMYRNRGFLTRKIMDESHCILIMNKPFILGYSPFVKKRVLQARYIFAQIKDHFHFVKKFKLQDDKELLLFKNVRVSSI